MFTVSDIIGKDRLNKLKEQHDEHARITGELEIEIINSVFKEYMDEDQRAELVQNAKTFSFSKEKLTRIESAFTDYNKDSITYNVATDIIEARNHIKEHGQESFFSKIANLVISEDD